MSRGSTFVLGLGLGMFVEALIFIAGNVRAGRGPFVNG